METPNNSMQRPALRAAADAERSATNGGVVRVFHMLSAKWAREDVVRRRLKVALFPDLNDPFELAAGELYDRSLRQRFIAWRRPVLAAYGVLCFSRSWRNPVLWSHYAAKHGGLCLGFDVPDDDLRCISYVKGRLPLNANDLGRGPRSEVLRERLFCAKFEHWQYEDEIRVIVRLSDAVHVGSHYFRRFDAALRLRQVIVGPRCSVSRAEVLAWLGKQGASVALTKARLAFKSFSVVEDKRGLR